MMHITPTKFSDRLEYVPHTGNKTMKPVFDKIAAKFNLKLYQPFLINKSPKIYYFTEYGLVCYPSSVPRYASECPKALYQLLKGERKVEKTVNVIGSIFTERG